MNYLLANNSVTIFFFGSGELCHCLTTVFVDVQLSQDSKAPVTSQLRPQYEDQFATGILGESHEITYHLLPM